MRHLSPSEREVLRQLLDQPDTGKSFRQLHEGYRRGITERGLSDALQALVSKGYIEKTTVAKAKGSHWNYRVVHPALEEVLIGDVVDFLKDETAERSYTGVPWMGLISSSDARFGQVLNEDQGYNEKFLELFLLVHGKWWNHVIRREYEDKNRVKELKIVREYEGHLLECLRLYKAPIRHPFTGGTFVIDSMPLLRYNILEQSQMMRGMDPFSKKHPTYCDFVLWWLRQLEEKGYAPEAVQKAARSHKAFLQGKSDKQEYESFLSRIALPQSVLFMPFSFSSPLRRGAELMDQFRAALQPSEPSP